MAEYSSDLELAKYGKNITHLTRHHVWTICKQLVGNMNVSYGEYNIALDIAACWLLVKVTVN